MRITRLHINAIIVILCLAVITIAILVVEAITKVIACALGEVLILTIGGMVWCAKAFAVGGGPDTNGDSEKGKEHETD